MLLLSPPYYASPFNTGVMKNMHTFFGKKTALFSLSLLCWEILYCKSLFPKRKQPLCLSRHLSMVPPAPDQNSMVDHLASPGKKGCNFSSKANTADWMANKYEWPCCFVPVYYWSPTGQGPLPAQIAQVKTSAVASNFFEPACAITAYTLKTCRRSEV